MSKTQTEGVQEGANNCGCDNSKRTQCEVWTRVMGYHRPVSHFNTGKKSEHYSRKHFTECVAANNQFEAKFATIEAVAVATA